jgi:alpha-glucosidase
MVARVEIFAFHAPMPDLLRKQDGRYVVTLLVPAHVRPARVWVRSEPDNEEHLSELKKVAQNAWGSRWEGRLRLNPSEPVTLYAFKMLVADRQYWLDGTGKIKGFFPERDLHFHFNPTYAPAHWVRSQVFYQIFPDRFADGDSSNNVRDGEYLYEGKPVVAKAWGELPTRAQGAREFYGGDLQGIRQRLSYLQELGITTLYLNPVFASPSSHKYDTTDYYRVDPHFGTNEELARLCEEVRTRGMRIILDAVVNHTSERHPWFDRHAEHDPPGAFAHKDAPTRDFYVFNDPDDPESYAGWYGVRTLPVLDFANPGVRRRVYEADDAILRYWMRPPYRIDGWRFDVIHMLGEGEGAGNNARYARAFRKTLREENPEAYMLGEHFFEATKWLQGDQEDGAMNYYGFAMPVRAFFGSLDHRGHPIEIDAADLDFLLERARARIPFEIQLSQLNLLGSHDTARFLTVVKADKALMKCAVTMLFTYIGVPSVYYGDEVGLEGGDDPDCRRTFPWDETRWDTELQTHYQTLIRLRRDRRVLQEGAFLSLHADADVFAFARVLQDEVVIVILNRGDETTVALPVWKTGLRDEHLRSLFNPGYVRVEDGILTLTCPQRTSDVLLDTSAESKPHD